MFELRFRELDSHDPRRVPLRGVAWLEPHMNRACLQVADGGPAWAHEGFDTSGVAFQLAAGGSALLTVDKPVRLDHAEPGGALLKLTPARSMRKAALAALTAHHHSYAYYEGDAPGGLALAEDVEAAVWLPGGRELLYLTGTGVYNVTLDTLSRAADSIGYWHMAGMLPFKAGAAVALSGRAALAALATGLDGRELSLKGGPDAGRKITETVKLINL